MSRKVDAFRQQIAQPLNTHNFYVDIPELGEYALTVQSTTFPSEQTRVVNLNVAGEQIQYATVPDNSHAWSIRIPENESGKARSILEGMRKRYWNQESGAMTPVGTGTYQNIRVYARDLNGNTVFSTMLHNAFVLGRGDVALDQSAVTTPWQWDYQFRFDYLVDSE